MTLNSPTPGSGKIQQQDAAKNNNNNDDFEDADIEWINDIITKQKDRKAPISIQTLRQEMASFHNLKAGGHQRNRDTLASTWHGANRRGVPQKRHHSPPSSMPKATMKTRPEESSNIPTMEELQTIMAAKLSYSKVKDLVQDQAHNHHHHQPQPSTTSIEQPLAPNSLPTVEDLQFLMAQAISKSKDYPTSHGDKCTSKKPCVTAPVGESADHPLDSAKKNKKLLQSKSEHRSKAGSSKAASLSPVRDSTDRHRHHHIREGSSQVDPLRRSSHHRHTSTSSRSEADQPKQPKVLLETLIDSGARPKVREPSVCSTKSTHDRQDKKSQTMGMIASRDKHHHDARSTSSVASTGDKRGKVEGTEQKTRGKPTTSGDRDKNETNTLRNHQTDKNRSASLGPKPRNRVCSRGRSHVATGADGESGSIRSRAKVRSTSGDRRQQRVLGSDAMGKRRVLKGAKQEITLGTQSGGQPVKPKAGFPLDRDDSDDDGDHDSNWMAASIMNFEDDWGNFRPKSTRPVLDADRAMKLASLDEKQWR